MQNTSLASVDQCNINTQIVGFSKSKPCPHDRSSAPLVTSSSPSAWLGWDTSCYVFTIFVYEAETPRNSFHGGNGIAKSVLVDTFLHCAGYTVILPNPSSTLRLSSPLCKGLFQYDFSTGNLSPVAKESGVIVFVHEAGQSQHSLSLPVCREIISLSCLLFF